MASSDEPKPFQRLGSVLVTGGCGFLGSHIVSHLVANYDLKTTSVSVLDLRTSSNRFQGATYYDADLTSPEAIRDVLAKTKPNVVIHTASPVFSSSGPKMREIMYKVNVQGTRCLLEESKRIGTKAFVYTSSASVISDCRTDLVNADERWSVVREPLQAEYYSDTKAEADTLVLAANSRSTSKSTPSFLTTSLRPASMFGERDVQFIPPLLATLKARRTGVQLGDNNNLFDCTYVGNAAHAHCLAASALLSTSTALASGGHKNKPDPGKGVDGEAFMITNASPVPSWDFFRAVWGAYYRQASATGVLAVPAPTPEKQVWTLSLPVALVLAQIAVWFCWAFGLAEPTLNPAKVRYSCMTRFYKTKKAQERFGYVPVWSLDEGVERGVKWFVEKDLEAEGKKGR